VSFQILAALPSIVPAIRLPENYKEVLSNAQVLNFNIFEFIGVNCFSSGFNLEWNLYWNLVCITLLPLAACTVLVAAKKRGGAIAVTFLVLPTVTTTIFEIFPCDELKSGEVYRLHADYSLRCESGSKSHSLFLAYGALMVLVWPVGVLAMYSYLLIKNRAKINQPVNAREEDVELMRLAFLFEPYLPEYWWFEVFQTTRRLAMTGVLGAISPGSDLQLGVGILMEMVCTMVYVGCRPFVEFKDNVLGVLASCLVLLVMLTALLLKHNEGGERKEGIGGFLIFMNVLCLVVFVISGVAQAYSHKHDFDNNAKSTSSLALGVLGGRTKEKLGGKGATEVLREVEEGVGGSFYNVPSAGRTSTNSLRSDEKEVERKELSKVGKSMQKESIEGEHELAGDKQDKEIEMRENPMRKKNGRRAGEGF
jgi:hypothetical protein